MKAFATGCAAGLLAVLAAASVLTPQVASASQSTAEDSANGDTAGGLFRFLGRPRAPERKRGTRLDNRHRVEIYELVRIEDVLAPGEAPPDPVFHDLYMTARAPQRMSALCDDVLATIGRLCDVRSPKVRKMDDGLYQISAWLLYLPAFDMGQRKLVKGSGWQTASFSFDPNRRGDAAYPFNTAANRRAAMTRMKAVCTEVVLRYGSCVPIAIDISPARHRGQMDADGHPPMSVHGHYEVYAPGDDQTVKDLRAFVTGLAAAAPAPRKAQLR